MRTVDRIKAWLDAEADSAHRANHLPLAQALRGLADDVARGAIRIDAIWRRLVLIGSPAALDSADRLDAFLDELAREVIAARRPETGFSPLGHGLEHAD